jgi:hypothetical protein
MTSDKKSSDDMLVEALRVLARDIDSADGVANTVIAQAADRIEQLTKLRWWIDLERECLRRDSRHMEYGMFRVCKQMIDDVEGIYDEAQEAD